jgi:predicted membrane channel-forming protein YqfA (hemolysin III family)
VIVTILSLAAVAVFVAFAFRVARDPFAWVPYAFYALGGILAVVAVTRHVRELEAGGLVALGTGWALNAIALAAVHPTDMRWGVYALYVLYAGRRLRELDLGRR